MTAIKPYVSLIDQIWWLLSQARTQVISHINKTMVITYRTIGQYIVEYEQGGADRAEYGNKLIPSLSKDLSLKFGKGFWERNIENMRKFYLLYQNYGQWWSLSPIPQTVSAEFKLSRSHYIFLISLEEKERRFYEIESIENNRSLRELKRQFDSWLYLRLALST